MSELAVHPGADAFAMMSREELAALAADIKANGLIHPIVLDAEDKTLIDGRNRLKACEIAGVEPRFEHFNGVDPTKFIWAANSLRRESTKWQKAMAFAIMHPGAKRGSKSEKLSDFSDNLGVSKGHAKNLISDARAVLAYSRELADAVRDGTIKLDAAIVQVKAEQSKLTSAESQLTRLREEAPDLADLVTEERLPLSEAYSAYEKRKSDEAAAKANQRETVLRLSEAAYRGAGAWATDEFAAGINDDLLADEEFCAQFIARLRINPSEIEDIQRGAKRLAGVISSLMKKGSLP
jgi:hypothetical protein